MTPTQLARIYSIAESIAAPWAEPITAAMDEFGIDTPARQAMFLAQVGHESGGLRWVRELWGPTPSQLRYEGRSDLGNVVPGDGKRFKGRGLIQITGRSNYSECGRALDLPLCEHPELLEQHKPAARSAGWFWRRHALNSYADSNDFEGATRRINGGLNGLTDRLALWDAAKEVLGAS